MIKKQRLKPYDHFRLGMKKDINNLYFLIVLTDLVSKDIYMHLRIMQFDFIEI